MGDWSEFFEDFPEENPVNWVGGRFDPVGAARLRTADELKEQVALESQDLQQRMFAMAEAAKASAAKQVINALEHNEVDVLPQIPAYGLGELDSRKSYLRSSFPRCFLRCVKRVLSKWRGQRCRMCCPMSSETTVNSAKYLAEDV